MPSNTSTPLFLDRIRQRPSIERRCSRMENIRSPDATPRLLEGLCATIRMRHYSLRTERTYSHWVRRFVVFHGMRHPRDMGAPEVTAFLTALATERHVAASTQNQALSAILFLYKQVLGVELPWLDDVQRAKKPRRLPTVLTQAEVRALLAHVEGVHGLMARLLYGTGMRLMEAVRLRVQDLTWSGAR
jgi:integrase